MSWEIEQELKNIRSAERGYYSYPFGMRRTMVVCYANTYEVAMSNLGFQIVYDIVNKRMIGNANGHFCLTASWPAYMKNQIRPC